MIADTKYIKHILESTPHQPGVYKMRDKEGEIIYIGKAKDLKKRLSTYFNSSPKDSKTMQMLENLADLEYSIVSNELEAIMLETNLIKQFRPKYNILMKDDKNYVYIKITVNEDFPRIFITRQVEKDRARYFGPKTAQHKVEKTLKILKRIFPFRDCSLCIDYIMPPKKGSTGHIVKVKKATIKYPCIDYHIARCPGPCIGNISKEEYRKYIDQIIRFFEGKHSEVLDYLHSEMKKAAAEKKFESAAKIRDKISSINDILEKQQISAPDHQNMDVINYAAISNKLYFNLFQIREGKLINQENFEFIAKGVQKDSTPGEEALESFIKQYYEKTTDLPKQVLVPQEFEGMEALSDLLSEQTGQKIIFTVPKSGRKDKLLELSFANALNYSRLHEAKWQGHEKQSRETALEGLKKLLNLVTVPKRIECYDISHHGGTETVASMVVFENGFPRKDHYRKFRLHQNTPGQPDDYKSIQEALNRRLKYIKPSLSANQIIIKKASKKESLLIGKTYKKSNKAIYTAEYFKVSQGENPIGPIEIRQYPKENKIYCHPTFTIEIKDIFDQLQLVKKIASKYKAKRLYFTISDDSIAHWEASGFQLAKNIPDNITVPKNHKLLIIDVAKSSIDKSYGTAPSLIVIDGGKGQLSTAVKCLNDAGLTITIISLAKKNEEVFIPNQKQPLNIPQNSPSLLLLRHLRDEAHRFAVAYHENVYLKTFKDSPLNHIPGIGESTKMKLLRHFGSLHSVQNATLYELEKIVGKKNAMKLKELFNETPLA